MKIISLFCGCGGMDLGLVKAGHKIVYANDNDKDSIETYKKYFTKKFKISPSHVHLNDVKKENKRYSQWRCDCRRFSMPGFFYCEYF